MWRTDSQVGMIVLHPPPVRKMNHPVPLLPPRAGRRRAAAMNVVEVFPSD
jgi:hypothetical protein